MYIYFGSRLPGLDDQSSQGNLTESGLKSDSSSFPGWQTSHYGKEPEATAVHLSHVVALLPNWRRPYILQEVEASRSTHGEAPET